MKNKLSKYILILLCLFSVFFIFKNNILIKNNIIFSINLWITKVFPSLFPMFVINELLISSEFPFLLNNLFGKITNKLFKTSGTASYVLLMSILSGTPSNAYILKKLVENNQMDFKEASYVLAFSFFSNPLFLLTMLTPIFKINIVIKIILIHYFSNIIIAIIFRTKQDNTVFKKAIITDQKIEISNVLRIAIQNSMDTLLMILGTITFYIIISTIIINSINLSDSSSVILKGLLEITQGLNSLKKLILPNKLKEIIAISIISFGGLSIHSQINNILSDTNIKYRYFLIGRILHVLISIFLINIF